MHTRITFRYAEISRDGRRIVTASADGTAQVWNAATGERFALAMAHGTDVQLAFFNPEGTRVVTISDDAEARVWDAATGEALTPPLRHAVVKRAAREGCMSSVAFSSEG